MGFMVPPAIAAGSALVRQAALYLGKDKAKKLAKEGAKDALEAAAKKATNKGIKDMRAANRLGTNVAKKAPKKKKGFGEKVVETLSPLSKGNKKIAPAIKGNVVTRKAVVKAVTGGMGVGAAANEVYSRVKGSGKTAPKSFGDTFAQARKDGSKTFMYKGDKYTTKLAKPKKK